MNSQQVLAKIKAYPLALTLLGTAIVLAGWAYYRSGSLDDLHGELDTITAQNDQTSENVKDGINLKEQLDELTATVAQFKPGLITPSAIIPNQQYFYDFEQSTGVQILDIEEAGSVPGKDPSEPSITTFKMGASGSWDNILTFIDALQAGPHYLRFSQFRIEKSDQTRSASGVTQPLKISFTVEVLGQ
jgi:Tfp pilus assembly protein PilO